MKCPSQITDCTSVHNTPVQHAPIYIHLAAFRDAFKFNGRETEQKYREIICQDTRKQNCLLVCQEKTEDAIVSDGNRKREKPQAMKEDVIDMIVLIKERSGTAEEKRGFEMLYTLALFNTVVFIRLRPDQ